MLFEGLIFQITSFAVLYIVCLSDINTIGAQIVSNEYITRRDYEVQRGYVYLD